MFGTQLADRDIPETPLYDVVDAGALESAPYRRRRQMHTLSIFAPAVVGGLLGFAFIGGWGDALLVFLSFAAAIAAFGGFAYPLRVMPATRLALGFAGPAAGGLVVGALGPLGAYDIPTYALLPAIAAGTLAAWLIDSIAVVVSSRRPVRIAVLGAPEFALGLAHELRATRIRAYDVVGWFSSPTGRGSGPESSPRHLGEMDRVRSAVIREGIDLLVLAPQPELAPPDLTTAVNGNGAEPIHARSIHAQIAADCLDLPVRMIGGGQLYEELFGHVPMGVIDDAWYLSIMHPRFRATSPLYKRAFDVVVAVSAGVVALPVIALAALTIRLSDRGPAFFRQLRIGEHGRAFVIVKLRTMAERAEPDGKAAWSVAGDERVTGVGRVLRRLHIDELPQLYNVLRGEMTIVGPRPERPELVAALEQSYAHYERRHLVKPGVTGWAQVRCGYAGSEVGSALKLCHDLYYLKHRSLPTDLAIMLETIVIAARDSHRPLRLPEQQFILGAEAPLSPTSTAAPELAGVQSGPG